MLNIRKENPNENLIQKPGIDSKGSSIRESFGSPSKKQGKKKKKMHQLCTVSAIGQSSKDILSLV